jgi:hypothetical protein
MLVTWLKGFNMPTLREKFINWLTMEPTPKEVPPCDFNKLKHEIRPGDVILVEGHSRVSEIVRTFTQSPWTHSALYVGRPSDIEDDSLRYTIEEHIAQLPTKSENPNGIRIVIEGLVGKGIIITPLSSYRHHHIRICRPIGLSHSDAQLVIAYAIKALGKPYNVRQLIDLGRFLLPWSILPKHWGSSLFTTPTGEPESGICSSLLAEAFTSVKFPILPYMKLDHEGLELFHRNPYVFTPKDFDYSPYFDIIKYPILSPEEQLPYYRRLPWTEENIMHQGQGQFVRPKVKKKKKEAVKAATVTPMVEDAVENKNNQDNFSEKK